ncbi:MAG TPA: ATP-dependent 6-phosphofructokinase [Vicinamibacterales bacterium]|jgi:6-phosphofructokinase 1|nr:ATP-dependent 6-phosphofructokinase [Vicinamibacterales bacterium]
MTSIKRIGILTGGGDAPGLNAVIRAVVKSAWNSGIECVGLEDSFDGLIEPDRSRVLTPREVTGILRLGGTILGTTNRGNPFAYPVNTTEGTHDYSDRVVEMFGRMALDALIVIGGDGTLAIAHAFGSRGVSIVGVPKTIDNDIVGTTNCFGFDTAVAFATDAIDRLHTTAEAHRRIIVVEVMGRYAGWIALYAGVAGGADAILIPEIPFDIATVAERLRERDRWGAKFSIVVVAEGACPKDGVRSLIAAAHDGYVERLGGIGAQVCEALARETGKETRSVVLGHLQRGGAPTSFDRVLATRFGGLAVELVKRGEFGTMVAFDPPDIVARRLDDVVGRIKTVPLDNDLLLTAKALGVTFGN